MHRQTSLAKHNANTPATDHVGMLRKPDLQPGQRVTTIWKGKRYTGTIQALDSKAWARRTRGRFVAITIQTDTGKLIGMPYTDKATYRLLTGHPD